MESVLSKLYNGQILPAEQYMPKTREHQKLRQKQYEHYEAFIKKLKSLNPALMNQFVELMDAQMRILSLEEEEMFIDGFCLGARMMIDIFAKDLNDPYEDLNQNA